MNGWLVDDDEEEAVTPIEEREGFDAFPFPPALADTASKGKRKAEEKYKQDGGNAKVKKRKVEVALIPYTKGPCWEKHVGDSELSQYRIHLFNGRSILLSYTVCVSLTSLKQIRRTQSIHSRSSPGPSKSPKHTKHIKRSKPLPPQPSPPPLLPPNSPSPLSLLTSPPLSPNLLSPPPPPPPPSSTSTSLRPKNPPQHRNTHSPTRTSPSSSPRSPRSRQGASPRWWTRSIRNSRRTR